jgi:hypothetical protein
MLYRVETIADPETGESITSRMRLGTAHLQRGGDKFSVVRAADNIEVETGDLIQVDAPPAAQASAAERGAATAAASTGRQETQAAERSAPTVAQGGTAKPNATRTPSRPLPTKHGTPALRRSERLRAANLGTTDRLVASGGYVSYSDADHYAMFVVDYTHYFYHRVVHSMRFGGGGYVGETLFESEAAERQQARLYYGLAALELSFTDWFGMDLEANLGVDMEGVGGGASAAIRVGKRDGINGQAGLWLRSYPGHEAYLAMEIPFNPHFKLTPRVALGLWTNDSEFPYFCASLEGELRLGRHFGLIAEVGGAARNARNGGFLANLGAATYF